MNETHTPRGTGHGLMSTTAITRTDLSLTDAATDVATTAACIQLPERQITFSVDEREWIEANGGGMEMAWEECTKKFQEKFQRRVDQKVLEDMWVKWKAECGNFCHTLFGEILDSGNANLETSNTPIGGRAGPS